MTSLKLPSATKSALRGVRDRLFEARRDACVKRCLRLPIDPGLVVFDNFNGAGYGCNPKYIAEALADSGLKLVWLARDADGAFPSYVQPVKYDSPEAWRSLAQACVRVTNVRNYKGVPKRDGQLYIQTWHGTMGFKCIEGKAEDLLSEAYLRQAKLDGESADIMFANNEVQADLYRNHFWYDGPVLRTGLPRMVPILRPDDSLVARVRSGLGVPEGKKVVLYAPTFRDNDYGYYPPLEVGRLLDELRDATGDEYECVVRLHPNMANAGAKAAYCGVIDATSWPDAQEVAAIADVLVTDYSSMAFEVMAADRPVFLFMPDADTYVSESRAFDLSPFDAPFPACLTMDELVEAIRGFDREDMLKRFDAFREKTSFVDDGMGDLAIADVILKHCSERAGSHE